MHINEEWFNNSGVVYSLFQKDSKIRYAWCELEMDLQSPLTTRIVTLHAQ